MDTMPSSSYGVIEIFDNAIADCSTYLAEIHKQARWDSSKVGTLDEEKPALRSSDSWFFSPIAIRDTTPTLYDLYRQVWLHIDAYAVRYDVSFSGVESACVNRYLPGRHYDYHSDAGAGMNRVISAVLYLNTVPSGGETQFLYQDVKVPPRAGRLVIFPSNYAYTHAALPPAGATKYSVAFWAKQ